MRMSKFNASVQGKCLFFDDKKENKATLYRLFDACGNSHRAFDPNARRFLCFHFFFSPYWIIRAMCLSGEETL